MPDLTLYEEDRTYVIDKFHNGHFDYIEVIQEVVQRDFFRYVAKGDLLRRLADSYPSPRNKPEVPAWFYLAADMAMRLHGNHAFNGFPWVVSTGGLLAAFARRWAPGALIPKPGSCASNVPDSTTRTTIPGPPRAIRATCARWP